MRMVLHWDHALIQTATIVTDWMTARHIQLLKHLPYLPDLTPADFFLFPKVKKELAGLTLARETFKKEWEGAVRTFMTADFAKAFQQWYHRCKKCVAIGSSYIEKTCN
jgi:histone-lysine N-methyltransferase SETMAR